MLKCGFHAGLLKILSMALVRQHYNFDGILKKILVDIWFSEKIFLPLNVVFFPYRNKQKGVVDKETDIGEDKLKSVVGVTTLTIDFSG